MCEWNFVPTTFVCNILPGGWLDLYSLPHPQGRWQEPRALRRAAGRSRSLAVRSQLHSSPAGPRRRGPTTVGLTHRIFPGKKLQDNFLSKNAHACRSGNNKGKVSRQLSFRCTSQPGWRWLRSLLPLRCVKWRVMNKRIPEVQRFR